MCMDECIQYACVTAHKGLRSRRSLRAHDNKFVCDKVNCPTCSPLTKVLLHQTISHTVPHLWSTQHTHSPQQPFRLTCFPANLFAQLWCDHRPITHRHMMHTHKREWRRKMRKEPPTERPSFLNLSPSHPSFLPHSLSPLGFLTYPILIHLQLSHSVCGCNYSCPSLRLSLNNGTPQRPRSRCDTLSKFDFSSHLRSINSTICWILYLNCSIGCQESVCVGKGRRTVLEKLHWWWMTGEIDHDVREKKLKTKRGEERETSPQHPLFFSIVVFFILAQRKLSSGESERFPLLLLLLLSPSTTIIEPFYFPVLSFPFCLSSVGVILLVPTPCFSLFLHFSFS